MTGAEFVEIPPAIGNRRRRRPGPQISRDAASAEEHHGGAQRDARVEDGVELLLQVRGDPAGDREQTA